MAVDYYHQWLNVRSPQRPPDHYALLGLRSGCDDPEAIEAAVRKQMDRLDQYSLHPDREARNACQELMNHLAMVRVCLVDVDRKAAYDRSLGVAAVPGPASAEAPAPSIQQARRKARATRPVSRQVKEDFRTKARTHLMKWHLNPHEELLLVAEAACVGLDEEEARAMIRSLDATGDYMARRKVRRWALGVIIAALATVAGLVAAVIVPQILRSRKDETFEAYYQAAKGQLSAGDFDTARAQLTHASRIDPARPEIAPLAEEIEHATHLAAAKEAITLGNETKAKQELAHLKPAVAATMLLEMYMNQAAGATGRRDYDAALAALRKARQAAPGSARPGAMTEQVFQKIRTEALQQVADPSTQGVAERLLTTLHRHLPNRRASLAIEMHLAAAQGAIARQDWTSVAGNLSAVDKAEPLNARYRQLRGAAVDTLLTRIRRLLAAGKIDQARPLAEQAVAIGPGDPRCGTPQRVLAAALTGQLKADIDAKRYAQAGKRFDELAALGVSTEVAAKIMVSARDARLAECRAAYRGAQWAALIQSAREAFSLAGKPLDIAALLAGPEFQAVRAAGVDADIGALARKMLEVGSAIQEARAPDVAEGFLRMAVESGKDSRAGFASALAAAKLAAGPQGFPARRGTWRQRLGVLQFRKFDVIGGPNLDLGQDVTLWLAPVPARGRPQFFAGLSEVTNAQWQAVMKGASIPTAGPAASAAAGGMSWAQAREFCTRVSRLAGKTVRLPTEEEYTLATTGATVVVAPPYPRANAWGLRSLPGVQAVWLADRNDKGHYRLMGGTWTRGGAKAQWIDVSKQRPEIRWGFRVVVEP